VTKILAIETSCDDTCAAVLDGERVLASVISSQTDLHAKWGGVVPDIAKRAHQSRIKAVIATALVRSKITNNLETISNNQIPISKHQEAISNNQISISKQISKEERVEKIIEEGMKEIEIIGVTKGPGLAIALGVGVNMAKELALKYDKKLVAVNHIEGHLLSNWTKNSKGKPENEIELPALGLTVSGGHTKLVLIKAIGNYEVVGETLDDAGGEALDKAAKLMGLGYPGGPVIERLAQGGEIDYLKLPHPLEHQDTLDYSFSGLKTSFYYQIKEWSEKKVGENLKNLSASFQEAVFETLIIKYKKAIKIYKPKSLVSSGGVMANLELRKKLRKMAKGFELPIYMPKMKYLNTDNAAMIGTVAYFKAKRGEFVENIAELDRDPRLKL
jgi:N6-L-threonylcarbamoyladenine synthase